MNRRARPDSSPSLADCIALLLRAPARHHAPHSHRPPDAAPLVCAWIQSTLPAMKVFKTEVVTIRVSIGRRDQREGHMFVRHIGRHTNDACLSAAFHTRRH